MLNLQIKRLLGEELFILFEDTLAIVLLWHSIGSDFRKGLRVTLLDIM